MQMNYRVRGVPIWLRLMVLVTFATAGILLQTQVRGAAIPGTLLVIVSTIPMWAKSYDNRPKDLGFEDWKPVTFREIDTSEHATVAETVAALTK